VTPSKPSPTSNAPRDFYTCSIILSPAKVTGQIFGTATTGLAINLLRIEENLSAAWQRQSGPYVENLFWLECAERYDRAHTFHYMDPPYRQTAG
jgi:DNA adenine methylase